MASYNATINLSVAGASQLDRVLARVGELDTLARRLSANPINVFGRGQAGDIARTALKPFQDISRAIENGATAAANSVAKTNLLANTFKTLASNVKIASADYENFIRVAGRAAAAAEKQNKALETAIDAERRAALGLQPQSERDLEVARRTTFVENERRRRETAKAALQDEIQLQQALLRLEEKSASIANAELQARGEIARLSAQGVNAAAFRAAQTGSSQLALPAFQERGLQLLDDSVKLNASQLAIETALNGQRQRGVRFLEKQTAEEARQVELGILGARTNRLGGTGRAAGAVPAGGFPVAGPLQSPGFQKTQKSVGKFGENLALGAGFPLLFGGGPGAVLGSVAGSFVGSGFGGQILGGALGQILDQAVQKTAQLGSALQTLNLDKFRESGVQVNAVLETQITLLRQAGDAAGAQALAQQQVLAVTGALPGTVEDISNATNILGSAWSEFTAAAGVTLGIVGAPFAAALGAIINAINVIVKGINVALSAIGTALKVTGEWVTKLIGGEEAVKNIEENFKNLNAEIQKARAEYQPILASLNGEILLNRELLNLEKQKTTTSTAAGKQRNADLAFQQAIIKTNAETEDKIREANSKITEANKVQVAEQVRQLNVRRDQTIEAAKLTKELELQRIAEAEREKSLREAERARDMLRRQQEEARKGEIDLNNEYKNRLNLSAEIVKFTKGDIAGYNEQLRNNADIFNINKQNLRLELQSNLANAESLQAQRNSLILHSQKLQNLENQSKLEANQIVRARELLRIEQARALLEAQYAAQDRARGLGLEQARVGITLRSPFDPTTQARENLLLDQRARQIEQLLPLQREIARLQTDITAAEQTPALMGSKQLENNRALLLISQQDLNTTAQKLNVLNQMEQQQQRLNEFTQQYGQIFDTVGQGLASTFNLLIQGSEDWGKSLQQIASNVLTQIAQQLIQIYVIEQAIGFLKKVFAPAPIAGTGIGSLEANLQQYAPLPRFADGGRPPVGKPSIVGERGPELFVPSSSGTIVPNYMLGGMGGDVSVVVNVDANGSQVQGNENQAKALGGAISAAVQAEIVKQQRPGGLLAGTR